MHSIAERPLVETPPLDPAHRAAAERLGFWAREALEREVNLTPKPGLVDRRNSGAHRDMDLESFLASAQAIGPDFVRFASAGVAHARLAARDVLPQIRPIGLASEQAMYAATGGVNTHKGGIFALGLLCTAAGRLLGRGGALTRGGVCAEVADICRDLVQAELNSQREAHTAGEHLFRRYGLTGARGEAASGYATARQLALPVYLRLLEAGYDDETSLLQALLHLMAGNADTNLVSRGGPAGLDYVREAARALLRDGGVLHAEGRDRLAALDDALIERNLSPGGSADLLSVTCFLARFPERAPLR
ncbi:triphosphoribosyl-dephospho-CoA synthase CitG [Paludibacterium yongneupense]|uniref:triphosphoribosyl-dephospho-CoA synthase CitG n=2 Tax=Paludibacterium yongneupense TaxID=400061 RepID=UPI001C046244|nr:triphosphoribosyl-dephospho-CoA synthase CitG [Paludibacterium yongneupense]